MSGGAFVWDGGVLPGEDLDEGRAVAHDDVRGGRKEGELRRRGPVIGDHLAQLGFVPGGRPA